MDREVYCHESYNEAGRQNLQIHSSSKTLLLMADPIAEKKKRLDAKWKEVLAKYPHLSNFGTKPYDERGNLLPAVRQAVDNIARQQQAPSRATPTAQVQAPDARRVAQPTPITPATASVLQREKETALPFDEWVRSQAVSTPNRQEWLRGKEYDPQREIGPAYPEVNWRQRGEDIARMAGDVLVPDMPFVESAADKRAKEARATGAGYFGELGARLEPTISGYRAMSETLQPASALLSVPFEEGVRKRYSDYVAQGVGQEILGIPFTSPRALQSAYRETEAAGELGGGQKIIYDLPSEPAEWLPGGIMKGVVKKAGQKVVPLAAPHVKKALGPAVQGGLRMGEEAMRSGLRMGEEAIERGIVAPIKGGKVQVGISPQTVGEQPVTGFFSASDRGTMAEASRLIETGTSGDTAQAGKMFNDLSDKGNSYLNSRFAQEGFGNVKAEVNFGMFQGAYEPSIVVKGRIGKADYDNFTRLMVDISEVDFAQSSVIIHRPSMRKVTTGLEPRGIFEDLSDFGFPPHLGRKLGAIPSSKGGIVGESEEALISLRFDRPLDVAEIDKMKQVYQGIDEYGGFATHADNQGMDLLSLTAYSDDYNKFVRNVRGFISDDYVRGRVKNVRARTSTVRHYGVEGDGLARYRDYRSFHDAQAATGRREISKIGQGELQDPAAAKELADRRYAVFEEGYTAPAETGIDPSRTAISDLIKGVTDSSPVKTQIGRINSQKLVSQKFNELLEQTEDLYIPGSADMNKVRYIARQTGQSVDDIKGLISDVRQKRAGAKYAGSRGARTARAEEMGNDPEKIMKWQEDWNDRFWGLRGLQTGFGTLRRVAPKFDKLDKSMSQARMEKIGRDDLISQLARYPGATAAAAIKAKVAVDKMKDIALTSVQNNTLVDDLNQFLIAKHGKEVFEAKKATRLNVGEWKSSQEFDDLLGGLQVRLGNKGYAELENAANVVRELYADNLRRFVETGFISPSDADILSKKYYWYNPLRYVERSTGASAKGISAYNPVKALGDTGRAEDVLMDPMDVLIGTLKNHEHQIALNDINRTIIKLALKLRNTPDEVEGLRKTTPMQMIDNKGDDAIFRPMKDPEGHISFFDPADAGKRKTYKVPEYITRELEYLTQTFGPQRTDSISKFVVNFNRFKRAGVTTFSPVFIAANLFNDMLTVGLTRGVAPWKVLNELRTTVRSVESDPFYQAYVMAGGRQQRFYGLTEEQIMKQFISLEDLRAAGGTTMNAQGITRSLRKAGGNVVGMIPKAGEAGEMAPRFAAAKKYLDNVMPKWRDDLASGVITPQQLAESPQMKAAVENALESTINFGRGGVAWKQANNYLLFINAAMEGMKLPIRAIQRNPKQFTTTMAAAMMGQGLLTSWNTQQEGYFDIPLHIRLGSIIFMLPSKETDAYGNPKPRFITLTPKTREWAAFLGSATFVTEKMVAENPTAATDYFRTLALEVTPGLPIPEAIKAPVEAMTGYSLYKMRGIVRPDLAAKPPEEQYTSRTSPTLRAIAGKAPKTPDWAGKFDPRSPQRLEHIFHAVFGGAGGEVLATADFTYRMLEDDPEPEIKKLSEEYKKASRVEQLEMETKELTDSEVREQVTELAGRPDVLPGVASGLKRRFYPDTGGELYRVKREKGEEETGIDPDQTMMASRAVSEVAEGKREEQQERDDILVNNKWDDNSYRAISDRIDWRERRSSANAEWKGIFATLSKQFPKSAQAADPESRKEYYSILATALGTIPDTRSRGQVLMAAYRAIQPDEDSPKLTEEEKSMGDLDYEYMFDERERLMNSLSPEDKALLNAEIDASDTAAEVRYRRDIDTIRQTGFWDIKDNEAERAGVADKWREYQRLSGRAKTLYRNKNSDLDSMLKSASMRQDAIRFQSFRAGTQLEDLLMYWGFYSKPIEEKKGTGFISQQLRQPAAAGDFGRLYLKK